MATALYRKYRPLTFSDAVGQEHIVRTLVNQIEKNRVGHAYLFTGSRGTGKTTFARIFARAINCLNPADGSPCFACSVCKALEDSACMDITEIDAASNNGVDDARNLRESVKYAPLFGKYKVYIIDEAHMLSNAAFNALLKTLEEPPAHAVFILATTEVHKLPATILSRCMRFDFRLVNMDNLTALLKSIYDKEGKKYEDDAVRYIASAGEGSFRDMLSIADMCLNYTDKKLKLSDVLEVLGASDRNKIHALFEAVTTLDYGAALKIIDEMAASGKSMGVVSKELTQYARDLLIVKTGNTDLIVDTKETVAKMEEMAQKCSVDALAALLKIFSETEPELRYSVSPRIVLETACVRACKLMDTDLSALEERLARLERGGLIAAAELPVSASSAAQTPIEPSKPNDAISVWGRVVTYLRKNESMLIYSLAAGQSDVEIKNDVFTVWTDSDSFLQMSESSVVEGVQRALDFDGGGLKLRIDKRGGADMEKAIDRIKGMMGGAELKIRK